MDVRTPMRTLPSASVSPPMSQFGVPENSHQDLWMRLPWKNLRALDAPPAVKNARDSDGRLVTGTSEFSSTTLLRNLAVELPALLIEIELQASKVQSSIEMSPLPDAATRRPSCFSVPRPLMTACDSRRRPFQ